jgi:excisionase family DNA binding protein
VNLKTAARRLGVHYQTAYRWVRSGALVAVKVGNTYEISEAALERFQAQHAALMRVPEVEAARPAVPEGPEAQERALAVLDAMADAITVDATALYGRAARLLAEILHDSATVFVSEPGSTAPVPVAWDHHDPRLAVLQSALIRHGRTEQQAYADRALAEAATHIIPQVPQHAVRPLLHAEFHQYLGESVGFYSAISAPCRVHGTPRGAVLVARDHPGRPFGESDRPFVESVAQRVAVATARAERCREAWRLRAELVDAMRDEPVERCGELVRTRLHPDDAVAVVDVEGQILAATKAVAVLFGASIAELSRAPTDLVRGGDDIVRTFRRMRVGELDYATVTVEPRRGSGRVMLNAAVVRLPDATPRCLVYVAHEVPGLDIAR